MKLKLIETTKQKVDVDVELPIYREHDVSSDHDLSIIYTRINEDLSAVHIHITGRYEIEVSIDRRYSFDGSPMDYHLGRGEYKSSKKVFEAALQEVKTIVNSV